MKTLHFYNSSDIKQLAKPEETQQLSVNSSALEFFTDFTQTQPLVIESSISAVEVKKLMQKAHVRMKFVIDDKDQFIGIVSADELIDRRLVQKISEGFKRDEVPLTDFMIPKSALKALDYAEVSQATIGDVITMLKNSGERHCLVIDREHNLVRGIFSASDLSRKLQLPIDIHDKPSFYKVFAATA